MYLCACSGTDEDDTADAATDVVVDAGGDADVVDDSPKLIFLELADDPDSRGTVDCDLGSAPGADIDAARLYKDPSLTFEIASLSDCRWAETGSLCETNKYDDASEAEGAQNSTALEGFVALNGGAIRCRWSDGVRLNLGNVVQVIEVSAGDATERYRLRACATEDGTQCGPYVLTTKAAETHPAGALFF